MFKFDNFHRFSQVCTGGSVVEFSPATREARVRFPASATHIVFSLVKPFFSFFFPLLFQFFPARELCRSDQKKKKKKKTKKSKQKNHQYNTIQRTNISRSQKLWHDDQIVLSFDRLFTNLLILRKWCRFEKPNHYYFV